MNIDILDLDIYIKECARRGVDLCFVVGKVGLSAHMFYKDRAHEKLITWEDIRYAMPNVIDYHVNQMLQAVLTFSPDMLSHGAPHYTVPPSKVEEHHG